MTKLEKNIFDGKNPVSRDDFLFVLNAAFNTHSYNFVVKAAEIWLKVYSGDLEVKRLLAEAFMANGDPGTARYILTEICSIDPEYIEAQELLYKISGTNDNNAVEALACLYATGKIINLDITIPEWSFLIRTAWQAFLGGRYDSAEEIIREVMALKPDMAFAAILHLKILREKGLGEAFEQISNAYHTRWPSCLRFNLYLAEAKFAKGEDAAALRLLNQCVVNDPRGQVVKRVWGSDHQFFPLWPEELTLAMPLQVPVEIASYLGWNNLPQGQPVKYSFQTPRLVEPLSTGKQNGQETYKQQVSTNANNSDFLKPKSEMLKENDGNKTTHKDSLKAVEDAFEKLSQKLNQPEIVRSDGRFPMYVIISLKSQLVKKYGEQTTQIIEGELNTLSQLIAAKSGWGSLVFYPDDPVSSVKLGLAAIDSIDPWKIKLAITDLDEILAKKGSMIGAMLIVGGPDVLPFHKLPNPTDDSDESVPSDNPYATTDGNYYVTEWPIGRLPGDTGNDAGMLLEQIRKTIDMHKHSLETRASFVDRLLEFLNILKIFKSFKLVKTKKSKNSNFGYTAAVWQRSSLAVFRPVGDGGGLKISPPTTSANLDHSNIYAAKYGYFNLHGILDGAEWFGQKDYNDESNDPDYPVALTPSLLEKNGNIPTVIFSEACFGANIINKKEEEAISLRFLGLGTRSFIGSTCVAYGSVSSPLIGADLLGNLFWRFLEEGYCSGEALMKAKIEFVQEMNKRQGFLDGEDQKTLLSFVLYGDPLLEVNDRSSKAVKSIRPKSQPDVMTMCDCENLEPVNLEIPKEKLIEVKGIVEKYLPGFSETSVHISQQQLYITTQVRSDKKKQSDYETGKPSVKKVSGKEQMVLTFHKEVLSTRNIHHHYARAKVNEQGKVIKLAISR